MNLPSPLLHALAALFAVLLAVALDRAADRRGLLPPGFSQPLRRSAAGVLIALFFYGTIFSPIASLGESDPADAVGTPIPLLFTVHAVMLAVVWMWHGLGYRALDFRAPEGRFTVQVGLASRRLGEDVALGLGGGIAGWAGLMVVMASALGVTFLLGGEDQLPTQAPEVIAWLAGLPLLVRLALSCSAGLVEEIFFRGFLQPRIGILASTSLFVLAHASYEQPFMLIGLTYLSLLFAYLVRWRQNIWPAVVAHAVFDFWQLAVVIPSVLKFVGPAGGGAAPGP